MAITGYLEEIIKNNKFNKSIKTALDYLVKLERTDFGNISVNDKMIIKLDGSNIFAINSVYKTRNHSEQNFEGHRKYIDLQYVFSGEEIIKISSIKGSKIISPYDPEKDVQFFKAVSYSALFMNSGMIAVFYPEDIHAPGLVNKNTRLVRKSVIKIKI